MSIIFKHFWVRNEYLSMYSSLSLEENTEEKKNFSSEENYQPT